MVKKDFEFVHYSEKVQSLFYDNDILQYSKNIVNESTFTNTIFYIKGGRISFLKAI